MSNDKGCRLVTYHGCVVDVRWSGFDLDLFISQEDKRDTEKIKILITPADAVRIAGAILDQVNNPPTIYEFGLSSPTSNGPGYDPPVLDLPWVPRPKNEERE